MLSSDCCQVAVGSPVDQCSLNPGLVKAVQQPNAAADICRPLVDVVRVWEDIAAAEYGFDGVMEGWDSNGHKAAATSEDEFMQVLDCHDPCQSCCVVA